MPKQTEPKPEVEGIYFKLWKAYDYFPYLQKDKRNQFHKYSYLSEAKIKQVAQTMLKELGLVFHYSVDNVETQITSLGDEGRTKAGVYVTVKASYEFIDIETKEKISGFAYGSGWDTNDKALYKAITGSIKYIFNSNFLIPTGDDPENDELEVGEQFEPRKPEPEPEQRPAPKPEPKSTTKPKESRKIEDVIVEDLGGRLIAEQHSSKEYLESIAGSDIEVYARALAGSINLKELKAQWMSLPAEVKSRLNTLKEILKAELS